MRHPVGTRRRDDDAVLIAQITDMHVRRKGDLLHHMIHTGRELRRAAAVLNGLESRPAFVVATGDLVDRGKPKEYKRLRKLLGELHMPIYLVPGNHDDNDALRAAFPDHRYLPSKGALCYVVESRPVRLVCLDTTRHGGAAGGELDDDRLAWLDATLGFAPATPTIVAMHHPPFDVGIGPVDARGFRGRAEFERAVAMHPQVARIVCGHVHRVHKTIVGGASAISVPSTAQQLVLDATDDGLGYGVRVEAPGFALHRWTGREVVTQIVRTHERASALRAVS